MISENLKKLDNKCTKMFMNIKYLELLEIKNSIIITV